MPKSRNRKGHRQKVASYKKRVSDAKKSFQNKMKAAYEKLQHEELEKQIAAGQVTPEEIDGLDVDEFQLDDIENSEELPNIPDLNSGVVQGISNPEQL